MEVNDLQLNDLYRTRSGRVCKVTDIGEVEKKTVSLIPYENSPVDDADEMPATLFTANIVEKVGQVDLQGNAIPAPGTPV